MGRSGVPGGECQWDGGSNIRSGVGRWGGMERNWVGEETGKGGVDHEGEEKG